MEVLELVDVDWKNSITGKEINLQDIGILISMMREKLLHKVTFLIWWNDAGSRA